MMNIFTSTLVDLLTLEKESEFQLVSRDTTQRDEGTALHHQSRYFLVPYGDDRLRSIPSFEFDESATTTRNAGQFH